MKNSVICLWIWSVGVTDQSSQQEKREDPGPTKEEEQVINLRTS